MQHVDASPLPIVCVPSALTREERTRSRELRRELAAATVETRAKPNGYSYRYRDDPEIFRKAAEWITLERRCCPFLTFELRWSQGASTPWLELTGPEGTREFLGAEMPELPQ